MRDNAIDRFAMETIDAAFILLQRNRYQQALVIIYSAMDTLAWSTLADGEITRAGFISWVDSYLDVRALGCTASDLYGARCGMVHSSSAASNLSRTGRATQLFYATASASLPTLRGWIEELATDAKAIGVTELLGAFVQAAANFSAALAADELLSARVRGRVENWLGFMPAVDVVRGRSPTQD